MRDGRPRALGRYANEFADVTDRIGPALAKGYEPLQFVDGLPQEGKVKSKTMKFLTSAQAQPATVPELLVFAQKVASDWAEKRRDEAAANPHAAARTAAVLAVPVRPPGRDREQGDRDPSSGRGNKDRARSGAPPSQRVRGGRARVHGTRPRQRLWPRQR